MTSTNYTFYRLCLELFVNGIFMFRTKGGGGEEVEAGKGGGMRCKRGREVGYVPRVFWDINKVYM